MTITAQPLSTRTIHGVTVTLVQLKALHQVAVHYWRYDLCTPLPAGTANALLRRNLIEHGIGDGYIPTSLGTWTLYEAVGEPVAEEIAHQCVIADWIDAEREDLRRNRQAAAAARAAAAGR